MSEPDVYMSDLAYRLFRRNCIDRIEMLRFASARIAGDTNADPHLWYSWTDHEYSETNTRSEWDSSGQLRAYWYQLAREAVAKIPCEPPKRISCPRCVGYGPRDGQTSHCPECGAPDWRPGYSTMLLSDSRPMTNKEHAELLEQNASRTTNVAKATM